MKSTNYRMEPLCPCDLPASVNRLLLRLDKAQGRGYYKMRKTLVGNV